MFVYFATVSIKRISRNAILQQPFKMISTGEHFIVKFDQKTRFCIHVHLSKIDAINQKVYIYTQHISYRHPP